MKLSDYTGRLLGAFSDMSEKFGSGDVTRDVLFIVMVLALLAVLVSIVTVLRNRPAASEAGFDRMGGVLGRLEKIEATINNFKTETARSLELLKGDVGFTRHELKFLRENVERLEREPGEEGGEVPADAFVPPHARGAPLQTAEEESPVESAKTPESLTARLKKTRNALLEKIKGVFISKPKLDGEMVEELEALLIGSDLGVKTVTALLNDVKEDVALGHEVNQASLTGLLKLKILNILEKDAPFDPEIKAARRADGPLVVLVVGVNGVGKTTTVAKLAGAWRDSGKKVMMVAADTFRAAAVEQLAQWGRRIGVPVVSGAEGAKPSTVVFDGMERAKGAGVDAVIIDTAGRINTKANLMQELEGIKAAIVRHQPSAPHEILLVLDGSTGQNALSQAREFNEAVKLTGIIITKLDGTPKGGIVVAIKDELGVPVRYIGVGEAKDDLRPFVAKNFVEALFDASDGGGSSSVGRGSDGQPRMRRDTTPYTIRPVVEEGVAAAPDKKM